MPKTKTVIISDVHLSDGPTKYSWFKDDSKLKGLLNQTANDPNVKELVLLGDFFDLWLYPVNVAPWTAKQVIQKWSGADSVVSALKECAEKLPNVFYINGNHDMGVTSADLALISPKIKVVTSDQYNATYANALHLEHGHLVDMFNAPDISDDAIKGLPFGYFITRLAATANNHEEIWEELFYRVKSHLTGITFFSSFMRQKRSNELRIQSIDDFTEKRVQWIQNSIDKVVQKAGEELITIIINKLIDYVQIYQPINDSSPIILPDGSTVSVGKVKKHYHNLLFNWYKKVGSLSDLYRNALASTDLKWYAEKLLKSGPAKLVVMGHTHEGKSMFRSEGQYANSGCWCAQKQATYVEIDPSASPKAVVKAYPGTTPLAPVMFIMASPSPCGFKFQVQLFGRFPRIAFLAC